TPEFRNRLDATVAFGFLPPEVVEMVVEKFILQLEIQLTERNVDISLDAEAKTWLAEKGYDKHNGARPLSRVIQEHIKKPLADELLFGKLEKGGEIVVKVKKDKLVFEITANAPKPPQSNKTGPKSGPKKGPKNGNGPSGKVSETVK
ncbi:MAG: ATP-dependent Clp protease ATP-binding subunit ClpA, partial [Kordiimonadaceae bacterium]|nr:ATP-dependent Clp protease ATP-binding subunit ClpA [Kordiimonadaceae bacterium]